MSDGETGQGGAWTRDSMRALGEMHARVETEGDLEATMATLVDVPIYEFWPIGRRATGREAVRRYYEHLIGSFMPSQRGFRLVEEWLSERSLAQEYEIEINGQEGPEGYRVIGILFAEDSVQSGGGPSTSGGLLGGERIWGSEDILRKMVGPVWDELEAIWG